jgi:tripartite-type tricarboxylate transporter receptor subunit TctC
VQLSACAASAVFARKQCAPIGGTMDLARWLVAVAAFLLVANAGPAQAQGDPSSSRTITLVVPIAAGGGMDTIGRILAEKLQDRLKQPVVVENRVGGGSVVGISSVARAEPDGRTLLLLDVSAVVVKWLNRSVPFDVVGDFAPVALVATTPLLLFAQASLPVADVRELVAYAKANPGKLTVGTPGVGTPHHLAVAMLNAGAKIDITHVPYRGTAPSLNDLLGGQIPLIWATPVAVMPFVEAGKVKILGTSSPQRLPRFPQVPTVAESALPGFNVGIWFAVAAPSGTPSAVIERLGREIRHITQLDDVKAKMSTLGYDLDFGGSERLRDLVFSDHARYGAVIRELGIQPN